MAHNIAFIHPVTGLSQEQQLPSYLQNFGYNIISIITDAINEYTNYPEIDLIIGDFRLTDDFKKNVPMVSYFPLFDKIPSILLTSSSKNEHLKLLLSLKPHLILYSPIKQTELIVNIDILINNYADKKNIRRSKGSNSIYIPKDLTHHKIIKGNITYVVADGSYCSINTVRGQSYRMSLNLKQFMIQINDPCFIRISRKHVINTNHVSKIRGNQIYIKNIPLKLTKSRKKQVMSYFKVLRSG